MISRFWYDKSRVILARRSHVTGVNLQDPMRESQIQIIAFLFAGILMVSGVGLVWNGRTDFVTIFLIFIPAFLFAMFGAFGPSRIKDMMGRKSAAPARPGESKRHFCSEMERNVCAIIADDFPPPKLTRDAQNYLEAAQKRTDETRSPEDYLILASQSWRMKNHTQALKYAASGLALEPEDQRIKAYLTHRLGTILQTMPTEETVVKIYNSAIALDPNFSWPHNSLGLTYRYQKNFEAADKEFQEAIRLYPENTRPHYNLGVSYFLQKRFGEAEKEFKTILEKDPQNYRAHNRLGLIYLEQGKPDRAEEEFKQSLKIEPAYAKAQKNLLPLLREKEKKAEEDKHREQEREKSRQTQREKEKPKEPEKKK